MRFVIGALLIAVALAGCGGESGESTDNETPGTGTTPDPDPPPAGEQTTVPVTISIEGAGLVEDAALGISCSTSCVAQVEIGAQIDLSATAQSGATFEGWSGACSGTGLCSLTAEADVSLGAQFAGEVPGAASGLSLFESVSSPGSVTVTLHPGSQVALGQTTRVAFGVPFPRGLVDSTTSLRLTDGSGNEIASSVTELARWRTIAIGGEESVRSALFYADVTFQQRVPQTVQVHFGTPRSSELGGVQPEVTSLWTSISNGPQPDEYPSGDDIREPIVYATLPPDWLGKTLLLTRTTPVDSGSSLAWLDSAFVNYARTAVNDVAETVESDSLIDLIAEEPWLYDRALTLFSVYVRTGDVEWLRRAHRAAQFYAKRVGSNGIFTLSSYSADLKYSYGMSPLLDYLLTGDDTLSATVANVAEAGEREWQTTYSAGTGFWTERHHTYAILAALSAFELTGDRSHADRATALADLTFSMSNNVAKCPLHTVEQHEGDSGDTRMMCSPWMGALLAEAMLRYYILSEDEDVLQWLAGMGDYIRNYALYDGGIEHSELAGKLMPWYLVGPDGQVEDGRGWGDMEHACEVAGLMAKSVWAKKRLGLSHTEAEASADDLLATCNYVLDYWHRSTPTLPEYRLTPPRKFSWWFGSSTDLAWMLDR